MGRETGGQGKKEKGRVGRQIPRGQGFKKNTHQSWDGESKSGMYMYRDQSRGINLAGHKSGFAVIKQANLPQKEFGSRDRYPEDE